MIVDPSAIVAILKREPGWQSLAKALDTADACAMSTASYVEVSIVVDRWKDPVMSRELDELIERFAIALEPLTAEQARIARQAYRDYGKNSGHPANLNFGDCFTYALTRTTRETLLYKGDDFVHTELRSAITS